MFGDTLVTSITTQLNISDAIVRVGWASADQLITSQYTHLQDKDVDYRNEVAGKCENVVPVYTVHPCIVYYTFAHRSRWSEYYP